MPDRAVTISILEQIAEHFRRCAKVYPDWVFEGYVEAVNDAIELLEDDKMMEDDGK